MNLDLVVRHFFQRADDRLDRTLYVGLDDNRHQRRFTFRYLLEHFVQCAARSRCGALIFQHINPVLSDFARPRFVFNDGKIVAGLRGRIKAHDLNRH